MASKSNPKKASTEKSKDEDIGNCGWCEKYGKMEYFISYVKTSFGAEVSTESCKSFCNNNCLKAYSLQEDTIDIKRRIIRYKIHLEMRTNLYKEGIKIMKNPSDEVDVQEVKKTGEALFVMIKYYKIAIDFYESVLRREKKDILTMKRYKCLKLAGDVYEAIQDVKCFESGVHDYVLDQIHGLNDHVDKNGEEKIFGAKAIIQTFGK